MKENRDRNTEQSDSTDGKEGTTVVAIKTQEGVVVAADKQTTGRRKLKSSKIYEVHPNAVISNAGLVTSIQALVSEVETKVTEYKIRRGRDMSMNALLSEVGDMVRPGNGGLGYPEYYTSTIVGGYDEQKGPVIAEVDRIGTVIEKHSNYYTVGSGGSFALGHLSTRYDEDMSLEEARDVAIDSLSVAAKEGPYTGIGIDLAKITEDSVEVERDLEFRDIS